MKILVIIILISSFFYPLQASWFFIIFFTSLEGCLSLVSFMKQEKGLAKYAHLNNEEKQILEKYYLYFRYPFASKSFSTTLSLISLSTIIFVPWLLYNHLWLQSIIIFFNYFLAGMLSSGLNIRFYLHDAVERLHKENLKKDMLLVDSVCNKLSEIK
jgi:hypothetical protein